ncbi:hypothetical protein SDC9_140153 [bioreactor metagenome]|uniref:Uncharacterized protein n=1 Tax=bioreactor metagenome TaxID=1076179 RepID=A0A645DUF8_9ZZZZ
MLQLNRHFNQIAVNAWCDHDYSNAVIQFLCFFVYDLNYADRTFSFKICQGIQIGFKNPRFLIRQIYIFFTHRIKINADSF